MTVTREAPEYDVTNLDLAAEGVRRIEWAEREMPVLRTIRDRFASEQPLKAPRGFRMDARCDWGCGGGVQYPMPYCPWCGRPRAPSSCCAARGRG